MCIGVLLFNSVFTHTLFLMHCFYCSRIQSLHWRTGSSELLSMSQSEVRGAMKTCWSLPVSSAVRPASPCSAPSPPAARSGDWRCPAWSPSARLRTNEYRSHRKGKNMRLISVPVYTSSHLVSPLPPHLRWSRHSLCPLGLWLCSALWVASWSSASGSLKNKKAESLIKISNKKKKEHRYAPGIWLDCWKCRMNTDFYPRQAAIINYKQIIFSKTWRYNKKQRL